MTWKILQFDRPGTPRYVASRLKREFTCPLYPTQFLRSSFDTLELIYILSIGVGRQIKSDITSHHLESPAFLLPAGAILIMPVTSIYQGISFPSPSIKRPIDLSGSDINYQ